MHLSMSTLQVEGPCEAFILDGIEDTENLYGTEGESQMCIVPRIPPKTTGPSLATSHKVNDLSACQGTGFVESFLLLGR